MKFLFVVPPLTGHVNPTVSVARELTARGHEVAWVAHPGRVRPLLPESAHLIPLDDAVSDDVWRPLVDRQVRGLMSLQFLWEDVLVPLARAMLPGVEQAIRSYAPDVTVVDQQAIGGALAARRCKVRWATFSTTSAGVVDPLVDLPRVKEWVLRQVEDLQRHAGLAPVKDADLSPHRVIVFSTEALTGVKLEPPYAYVGPSISDRPDRTPFPFEKLDDRKRVFVSLGTITSDRRFYEAVVAALEDEQVIIAAPPELVPEAPNVIVQARVPQLALLPHVHAVICHAGHNTVCEALAHGLPLVVAPVRDDQPVIAGQVARAGAGVRVKFGRITPSAMRGAVDQALHSSAMRLAAEKIRDSFAAAGGARAAARLLEEMPW
jgi:MGT family glycosyltransferase